MRSIERKFTIEADKNPLLTSIMIFSKTVNGQRFNRETILRWFNTLVDKHDYSSRDKSDLIDFMVKLSNGEGREM